MILREKAIAPTLKTCLNLVRIPRLQFSEMERLSSCASELMMVKNSSPAASRVLMFSFSKNIPIPRFFSFPEYWRHSCVFRAKREMDFVITMSILPSLSILWGEEDMVFTHLLRMCERHSTGSIRPTTRERLPEQKLSFS